MGLKSCGCSCGACAGNDHENCSHVARCFTRTACGCPCDSCRMGFHLQCEGPRLYDPRPQCKLPTLPRAERSAALKRGA